MSPTKVVKCIHCSEIFDVDFDKDIYMVNGKEFVDCRICRKPIQSYLVGLPHNYLSKKNRATTGAERDEKVPKTIKEKRFIPKKRKKNKRKGKGPKTIRKKRQRKDHKMQTKIGMEGS